jgi:hypothetical protein
VADTSGAARIVDRAEPRTDRGPERPTEHDRWRTHPITGAMVTALAFVAGAAWVLFLTRNGLGAGPDSLAYLGAAQNVADGRGLTLPFVPVTVETGPATGAAYDGAAPLYHYSPLLPAALGALVRGGFAPRTAARAVDVVACGATAAGLAWAVLRQTRQSIVAAVGAVALLLTTEVFIVPLTAVATEAAFIPLSLFALGALAWWLARPEWWWAAAFVALASAATLARTVGIAVIATGLVAVLLWFPTRPARRALIAVATGAAAVVPALAWRMYDGSDVGGVGYHPPSLLGVRGTLSSWLSGRLVAPWSATFQTLLLVVAVLAVVATVFVLRGARSHDPGTEASESDRMLLRVAWLFAALYTLMLYVTITFVVITVPFGTRYMLPVLPPIVFLLVVGVWRLLTTAFRPATRLVVRVAVALGVVALAGWHLTSGLRIVEDAREVRGSPPSRFYDTIDDEPEGTVVFTNLPHVVSARTGHFAVALPLAASIWTGEENADYARQRANIGPTLCNRRGIVALPGGKFTGFAARRLVEETNVRVTDRFADGLILRVDPEGCDGVRQPRAR